MPETRERVWYEKKKKVSPSPIVTVNRPRFFLKRASTCRPWAGICAAHLRMRKSDPSVRGIILTGARKTRRSSPAPTIGANSLRRGAKSTAETIQPLWAGAVLDLVEEKSRGKALFVGGKSMDLRWAAGLRKTANGLPPFASLVETTAKFRSAGGERLGLLPGGWRARNGLASSRRGKGRSLQLILSGGDDQRRRRPTASASSNEDRRAGPI